MTNRMAETLFGVYVASLAAGTLMAANRMRNQKDIARTAPGTDALEDTFSITIDPTTQPSAGSPGSLLMANGTSPSAVSNLTVPASVTISPAGTSRQFQSFSAIA